MYTYIYMYLYIYMYVYEIDIHILNLYNIVYVNTRIYVYHRCVSKNKNRYIHIKICMHIMNKYAYIYAYT
jgi:hypothetical protein